jgi:protein-S-isoprenylcysteine O-methyltransferase Ste14
MPLSFVLNVFCTFVHVGIFFAYSANYSRLRKNRKYTEGRPVMESKPIVRILSKTAFTLGAALTALSFWVNTPFLLKFHFELAIQVFGVLWTLAAFVFLLKSLGTLGENYSPCFDSHRPKSIVTRGPYRYVRHPVYLANILLMVGFTIASGSWTVALLSLYGTGQMIRSVLKEEKFLSSEFPEYKNYQAQTWRLFPFVF